MGLEKLQREYPPGARGIGARVLREYRAITDARTHGWTWAEIAQEMGLETKAAPRALANAYARVTRKVEVGHLVPPKAAHQPAARPGVTAPPKPASPNQPFDINSIPRIGERTGNPGPGGQPQRPSTIKHLTV